MTNKHINNRLYKTSHIKQDKVKHQNKILQNATQDKTQQHRTKPDKIGQTKHDNKTQHCNTRQN